VRRLGIRNSLWLGFGVMLAVMAIGATTVLLGVAQVSESVDAVLLQRLPSTMDTLRVARAAEALSGTGAALALVSNDTESRAAFARVDRDLAALREAFSGVKGQEADARELLSLTGELTANLERLRELVTRRIRLVEQQAAVRAWLLVNLQAFQQELAHRARIIQADSGVIQLLLAGSDPPFERIARIAGDMSRLVPAARFYGEIEAIHGRLSSAGQEPNLRSLQTAGEVVRAMLELARSTYAALVEDIARPLEGPFDDLQDLALSDDGLLALHERELRAREQTQAVILENQRITERIDAATAEMVRQGLAGIDAAAGRAAGDLRGSIDNTVIVTIVGFVVILALSLYVNRSLVRRLSWLSRAMQELASGRLDARLPPEGGDELGRLGNALQQFRATAVQADRREAALRSSKSRAARAVVELEQRTRELELANDKLAALSVQDALTGLYNRRRFDEALESEWGRAGHARQPVALLMIDVDHFKRFNDHYGHQAGDRCLREIADVIQDCCRRAGDLPARYGGEEFCVISPYQNETRARELAQSICGAVAEMAIPHEGSGFGFVTVSIGVSALQPVDDQGARDLLRAADEALYEAKAAGRNRVVVARTSETATGGQGDAA